MQDSLTYGLSASMNPINPRCDALASPNYENFGVSLFIVLGILVSYLPQHARIIRRRSSFGLSPYFVLLGVTSMNCFLSNIFTLPESQGDLQCCKAISGFACFVGSLGIVQVGAQWLCFVIIFILWLLFFPRATPSTVDPSDETEYPSFKTAIIVTAIAVVQGVIVVILSLYFTFGRREAIRAYANLIGVCGTGLAAVQYLPQIYTTFVLKNVGSLSIPMMCMQTPGSFIWAVSLAIRYGKNGWSTWGLLLVTGTLQGILLTMGIYFELKERWQKRKLANGDLTNIQDAGATSEESPLLWESE